MSFVEKYFFGTPKMPRNLDISTFIEGGRGFIPKIN
jgi:hypothetical protein